MANIVRLAIKLQKLISLYSKGKITLIYLESLIHYLDVCCLVNQGNILQGEKKIIIAEVC